MSKDFEDWSIGQEPDSSKMILGVPVSKNIHYLTGGGGVGTVGPVVPGGGLPYDTEIPNGAPEALRRRQKGRYTIEGGSQLEEFDEAMETADMQEIQDSIHEACAYMEGLFLGGPARRYNIDDDRTALRLYNMFTTSEDSTNRRTFGELLKGVREGLTDTVREVNLYEEEPGKWRREVVGRAIARYEADSIVRVNQQSLPSYIPQEIAEMANRDLDRAEARMQRLVPMKDTLMSLDDHVEKRILMFDAIFTERQGTVDEEEKQVQLTGSGRKPDKGHWVALYRGDALEDKAESEFGEALSKTERAILKVVDGEVPINGLTEKQCRELYARGFQTLEEFRQWLKAILPHTKIDGKERMDVVWKAWRLSLWKEAITKRAWAVDEDGTYIIGSSPLTTDLMSKMTHNEKVRASEAGWKGVFAENNRKGNREIVDLDDLGETRNLPFILELNHVTGKVESRREMTFAEFEKYVDDQQWSEATPYKASHFGHYMDIGKFGSVVNEYMEFAKLKRWEHPVTGRVYRNISLHEIWYDHDINLASKDFPWFSTEIRHGNEVGEPGSGSAGLWFLRRLRGSIVRGKQIRDIPSTRELGLEYFTDNFRNWDKLGLIEPGDLIDESGNVDNENGMPTNPAAWWLARVVRMRAHTTVTMKANREKDRDLYKEKVGIDDSRAFSDRTLVDKMVDEPKGESEHTAVSDVLQSAVTAKIISKHEYVWLLHKVAGSDVKDSANK